MSNRILKKLKKKIGALIGFLACIVYDKRVRANQSLFGPYRTLTCIAEYSPEQFKRFKKYNDTWNEKELAQKQRIKIGFVLYTSTTWNVDPLYKMFNDDYRFDVEVIVARRPVEDEFTEKEYLETRSYFNNIGYHLIEASKIKDIREYDILFYLDSSGLKEKQVKLLRLPLSVIILHTSYSYMLAGNIDKIKAWMYHLSYKYYVDSKYYKSQIDRYYLSTNNTEFFGFPKMDQYYEVKTNNKTEKKVIIYAPHHSVNYSRYKSATFQDNYIFMLELAKKYEDKIHWVYKPHPLLREHSVEAGIFHDVREYDDYVNQWKRLDHATVIMSGEYFSMFKKSDAMITDSVSFLAEYQFTQKPLLLLESGMEEYNDFGNSIVEILYRCNGKDTASIENFIEEILKNQDEMYLIRKQFFENNLDYRKNGISANERIFNQISGLIDNHDDNE